MRNHEMTDQAPTTSKPRRKRRVFLWVFLGINALMLVWTITAIMWAIPAPA